jgi:hypothetical protein
MIQSQYWKEIYQLKVHIAFIELLLERSERVDRGLKIFLAVASSSSIGAWTIWTHLSWIWAAIIAGSQVINAIIQYLPYKSRIKTYSSLLNELEEIMIQGEFKWHAIADGRMTESEINEARFDIRSSKQKALKKYIHTTIPTDTELQDIAENSAMSYFNTFYSA